MGFPFFPPQWILRAQNARMASFSRRVYDIIDAAAKISACCCGAPGRACEGMGMQLKDIKKEGIFTTLYYELTWKIGWEQLLSILDVVIRTDFQEKGFQSLAVGMIAGTSPQDVTRDVLANGGDIRRSAFAKGGIRLCSVDRLFASHESYNADHRLEPERPLYTSIGRRPGNRQGWQALL